MTTQLLSDTDRTNIGSTTTTAASDIKVDTTYINPHSAVKLYLGIYYCSASGYDHGVSTNMLESMLSFAILDVSPPYKKIQSLF